MHFKSIIALGLAPELLAARSINSSGVVCNFSTAGNVGDTCDSFAAAWGLTVDGLKSLNPGVDCSNFDGTKTYCVVSSITADEPSITTSPVQTTWTSTKKPTTTTDAAPSPTQSGLIATCRDFYFAKTGDTCDTIAAAYGTFTTANFIQWNPAVGQDCHSLWAETYYCVGIPSTPTARPTTTKAPAETCNPSAPTPTQPGAVCNCDKWHQVASSSTTCDAIVAYEGISNDHFYQWNPQINKGCTNLLLSNYVCVHVAGTPPPTTTTSKAPTTTCNPTAPTPTQPGAICKCDKWHQVSSSSTTCAGIIDYENISSDHFYQWNPQVNKSCTNLLLGYWVCVHVAGTPAETCYKGAPQPVQPGTICQCKKWHLVSSYSTTCDAIITYEHISSTNFYKWNPKIDKSCKGLLYNYNVCVGV